MSLIDADELLKALKTWDKFGNTSTGLVRLTDKNKDDYVPYVRYDDVVNCINSIKTVVD